MTRSVAVMSGLRSDVLALLRPTAGGGAMAFARGVAATLATRLAGIVVGVFTLTVTTRLLGAEGRGQFAVTMASLALVLQFANAGLHSSATYWLAREPARRREIAGLLAWFSAGPVALLCALAFVAVRVFPSLIPDVHLTLLALAMLAGPPAMFVLLAGNAFLGLGRATAFNVLDFSGKVAGLCAVAALFWWDLRVVFAVYAALHFVIAAVAWAYLAGPETPQAPSRELAASMFGFGSRVFLVSLFMFLVLRVDLFLLNGMAGVADAGIYSVAVQVGDILTLTSASVAAILFPRLTAMDAGHRWHSTMRVVRLTGVVLAAGALALAVVSRSVFPRWFGAEFAASVIALWWLLPGLWCLGVNSLLHQHLAAYGMPWFLVYSTLAGAVVNVIANLIVIPAHGVVGAAAVSSATYFLLLVSTAVYLARPAGRRFRA